MRDFRYLYGGIRASYCRSNCGECQASCFSDTGRPKKSLTAEPRYPFPKISASVLIFDKPLPEQIKPADNSSADAPKDLHCFFYEERGFCRVERARPQNRFWPIVIDKDFMSRRRERFFLVSAVIGRQNVSKLRAGFTSTC